MLFNALLVNSTLILLIGYIPYLATHTVQWDLVMTGFVSGNVACLGIVATNIAISVGGPAGPVLAI
jgi:hypothetical protein